MIKIQSSAAPIIPWRKTGRPLSCHLRADVLVTHPVIGVLIAFLLLVVVMMLLVMVMIMNGYDGVRVSCIKMQLCLKLSDMP